MKAAIPKSRPDATRLVLDPRDGEVLAGVLPELPGRAAAHSPVTVDLNGHVAVRAKADDQPRATELVLERSRVEGKPVRFVTDRTYLARAGKLGFGTVEISAADKPMLCRDGERTYLWMPLDPEGAVPPSPDVLHVTPPAVARPKKRKDLKPARPERAVRPAAKAEAAAPRGGDVLGEAVAVQSALRELLGRVRCLTLSIRQEQKRRRAVTATLASLRELQKLAH